MIQTLEPVIAGHPFFEGMLENHVQLLRGCASQVRFAPDQIVFRMGEPADVFYLLRHGRVALEVNGPERGAVILETIRDGDVLGWSWLVPPYRWALDARATATTLALAFDAACLRGKIETDHDLGYELYRRFAPVIADRLEAARLQVLDVHRSDV